MAGWWWSLPLSGMTTLQWLLLPTLDLCPQTPLYVNCRGASWFSFTAALGLVLNCLVL